MYTSIFRGNTLSDTGQIITLSRNESGYYVISGPTTAKVVKTDVLLWNGVVHVIDRVLMNTEAANPAEVSSAVGSRFTAIGTAGWSLAMTVGAFVGMALV